KGFRDKLGKEFTGMIKEVETKTGLTAADIERTTLVVKEIPHSEPMIFVGTTRAFDRKKVFGLAVEGGEEQKYSGETLFANERQAAYALGEKAFVIGTKGDIQSLIDAGKEKPTGGLMPALALTTKKHSVVVGINPAALPPIEDELPPLAAPFK